MRYDDKHGASRVPVSDQGSGSLRNTLVADLRKRIDSGLLAPGDQLPTIMALCERYGVSSITVRAALKELSNLGLLESRRGSGFFVRTQREETPQLRGEGAVALLIGAMDSPFFSDIIRGAEEAAQQAGYRIVLASSNYDANREARLLDELSRQVAGIAAVPLAHPGNIAAFSPLVARQFPLVLIDSYVPGLAVPLVATDNERGGYLATRHLIATGRRRVFLIGGQAHTSFTERITGYRRALKESKIPYDPEAIIYAGGDVEASAYAATYKLLPEIRRAAPCAIFALTDRIARGAMVALKEGGLSIPQDVAIAGFDDVEAPFLDPPLTSVRQDIRALGSQAVRLLLQTIRYGNLAAKPVRLAPELIVRPSTDFNSEFSLARYYASRAKLDVNLAELAPA